MKHRKVNLLEIVVTRMPTVLTTSELGSCIAIVLFDRQNKVGALGHILLPQQDANNKKNHSHEGKFADSAIRKMVSKMIHAGSEIKQIQAKIVGGAMFFQSTNSSKHSILSTSIGKENVKAAKKILKEFGIPVVGFDVGGDYGRRIEFYTHTGKVIVETTKDERKEI